MNKEHYTYKITDVVTKEYYVGVRTSKNCTAEEDDYMGSYMVWKPESEVRLEKEILGKYPTRKIANSFERKLLILALKVHQDDKCMNGYIPNIGFCTYGNKEVARKISEARIGQTAWNKGKKLSKEHKLKIKNALIGKKYKRSRVEKQKESLKKYYENNDGHWKGVTGVENPNYGKKLSSSKNCKSVRHIDSGEIYPSISAASESFDVHRCSIRYHCKNKSKNPEWEYYYE